MSDRKGLGRDETKLEKFRQGVGRNSVERFSNDALQAIDHDTGRNQAVAELLCYLSLIRNAGLLPKHATVTAIGAKLQSVRTGGGPGMQWAHCLPCGLVLNGKVLDDGWTLGLPHVVELSIKKLFALTTNL